MQLNNVQCPIIQWAELVLRCYCYQSYYQYLGYNLLKIDQDLTIEYIRVSLKNTSKAIFRPTFRPVMIIGESVLFDAQCDILIK